MNSTTEELEHLCFVIRVDLNGTKSTLEDMKNCVKDLRRRKDARHIIDSHVSFRDSLKKRVKNEQALLTKLGRIKMTQKIGYENINRM
tara:strand:+ start:70 stop:333 length:264 start_codon:yes stop_codon:yes gene_type:complete